MDNNEIKEIEQRAGKVRSVKVKKYVKDGLMPKIKKMGTGAGFWLERLEKEFGKLKPEGWMEGFEDEDFNDLYFVLTGDKRKKSSDKIERIAKRIMAGDEWRDEHTIAFTKEVAKAMKSNGIRVVKVVDSDIHFVYQPTILTNVPLMIRLMEFGYPPDSESVNGTITSPENHSFVVPGGFTRNRDAKELWHEAKKSLDEIFRMAMGRQ